MASDEAHDTVGDASARVQASITAKRLGRALPAGDIHGVVADYVAGRVADYQMAAWLATVACQGLDLAETAALTRAYVATGERLDLSGADHPVLDKHSTGGVGDKLSLIAVPLVAACGSPVVKMSGRGLGHAGGTVDKLESVSGLRLDLGPEDITSVLRQTGMVISGQSASMAPGDGATYALRDVTATVESIPLIAASIIGKKLAVGADSLVLDVKVGAGALIPDRSEATCLARLMVDLAAEFGLRATAVLGDMSQPLGYAVGNALEVREALAVLRGADVPGVTEASVQVARLMLQTADPGLTDAAAEARVRGAIADGTGYERFLRWAEAQGADVRVLESPDLLPAAPYRTAVRAEREGWVEQVEPRAVGTAALRVGAGRLTHAAPLDFGAGVLLHRRVGDRVHAGDVLAEVHHSTGDPSTAVALLGSAFIVGDRCPAPVPVIHEVLSPTPVPRNEGAPSLCEVF